MWALRVVVGVVSGICTAFFPMMAATMVPDAGHWLALHLGLFGGGGPLLVAGRALRAEPAYWIGFLLLGVPLGAAGAMTLIVDAPPG